jgi:hypothetical protein
MPPTRCTVHSLSFVVIAVYVHGLVGLQLAAITAARCSPWYAFWDAASCHEGDGTAAATLNAMTMGFCASVVCVMAWLIFRDLYVASHPASNRARNDGCDYLDEVKLMARVAFAAPLSLGVYRLAAPEPERERAAAALLGALVGSIALVGAGLVAALVRL